MNQYKARNRRVVKLIAGAMASLFARFVCILLRQ